MFLRNLLFLCFCVLVATGMGLYVYHTHAYIVWGLLAVCWLCYLLKRRAAYLFDRQDGSVPRRADHGARFGDHAI